MNDAADLRFTDPEPRIHPTAELKGCRLGRYAAIGERVVLRDVVVGDYSYFERHAEAIYTTIGNGAVVGANAVVTRDVAAYAIVAGNPARVLRPRFPAEIVGRIEQLAWWDWPQERLFEAVPDMQELSIEAFLDRWADSDV